ncbi:uncharacterized protein LAESUDRAFT_662995 [Laetiporus sulphureus 93-53]|uniref:FZ domain-containing protein n=1 Tax=Laetiporus sulphureus 93-53 TaxID=1314785 RepID=A0A165BYV4_9APHY|nr:uncharacterized protein LAESUDRAFT_662995 [Laetiporus sulphureus 93-53]KZT01898.1 hypothetical protein LAESUDRAFT_662995 [Laetiporus sulphureus 93-53]
MRLTCILLCFIHAWLVLAQSQTLSLNQLYNFSATTSNPSTYTLPESSNLTITVALCSYDTSNGPRFYLSNDSSVIPSPDNVGQPNIYQIELGDEGIGNWTGIMSSHGLLAVYNATQTPFEVGVSDSGPIHEILDSLPLFGDSTSNQVLIFSPPFSPPDFTIPTYPNYTLPSANLTQPDSPSSPVEYSIFIAETKLPAFATLPRTGCALKDVPGNVGTYRTYADSEGLWLRDIDGWRWQWFMNGLNAQTNYTMYAVENGTKVSGPIYFSTKSDAFACQIVHSLPFCPTVSYAAPIDVANAPNGVTASQLPSSVTDNLLSGYANFTVMLTTLACGRDLYSPLVTCADCQAAYRTWLCFVSLPRCAEDANATSSTSVSSTVTPSPALQMQDAANPRSPYLPSFPQNYTAVLPCLEVCNAADRACPPFLGFQCPKPQYTAAMSYGVGYIDSGEEGEVGGGSTGSAVDRWGNVWCNAPSDVL